MNFVDVILNIFQLLNSCAIWLSFLVMYLIGSKRGDEWTKSIRSMMAMLFAMLFVQLALTKLDPKDSLLIISVVINFYYLAKKRDEAAGNGANGDAAQK